VTVGSLRLVAAGMGLGDGRLVGGVEEEAKSAQLWRLLSDETIGDAVFTLVLAPASCTTPFCTCVAHAHVGRINFSSTIRRSWKQPVSVSTYSRYGVPPYES
jgi:hypothetical protein